MLRNLALSLLCLSLLSPLPALPQERINTEINAKIREEGMNHSKIMHTLHFLTDVYGPRLTGTPNHKAAAEWAIKEMASWGFENGHLEPWDFGHPGWVNDHLSAHAISPFKDSLVCEVLAWTPSTKGTVTAQAFNLIWPDHPAPPPDPSAAPAGRGGGGGGFGGGANTNPTQEELMAYLNSIKDQVKGKVVLVGKTRFVPVNINPPAKRRTEEQ